MELKLKNISYRIEYNDCLYDFTQYYVNNEIVADQLFANGYSVSPQNWSIRHKLRDFIKENKLTSN